jgi:hypothetical protein
MFTSAYRLLYYGFTSLFYPAAGVLPWRPSVASMAAIRLPG